MVIQLPRGLSIDIDYPPENLEELVQKAFAEYTYDKANRLIARIIRAVMTWEHPKEAEG